MTSDAARTPPAFDELVELLIAGNDPTVGYSGVFTEKQDGQVIRRRRVWRLRHMARVEEPPGHTTILAGEHTFWQAADDFVEELWELREDDSGDLTDLRLYDPRKYWTGWLTSDRQAVVTSLRATEFEGRPAWQFTAPETKGRRAVVTVDAELGVPLTISVDDTALTWSELRIESDLGPAFFEPRHRTPLNPPDPEPDPTLIERLQWESRFLDAVLRATDDWQVVSELVLSAEEIESARAAVAAHLGVDKQLASAVLDVQLRRLTTLDRQRIREQRRDVDHQLRVEQDAERST
ncbi:hypothetical protein ASE01_08385 [Nocardioides sp. Root190]|uniref:hypothetical protein n=1 Tax=Nocardioides sp. Root190 TaxID=1736488 RepID=UPI0006FBCFC7|nr:hypothetical protein [Nocardioides sp. Root190]KRB78161.1 hypothetical protein ASE01_08385 [Nocardioides sp. Root190]